MWVCAGDTGAPPPPVVLELAGAVCVTDVVAVVTGLVVVTAEVEAPVVMDRVVDVDMPWLWVVAVVDEL